MTTIAGLWLDDGFVFTTGPTERKAHNLAGNPACVVTTGSGAFDGFDVVVEGQAVSVTDATRLERIAEAYNDKYGDLFGFGVRDGELYGAGTSDPALVFELEATKGFAFGKGDVFSQTRYRFRETRP